MTQTEYKIYIDDIIRRVETARVKVSPHHIVQIIAISKYSKYSEIEKLYNIGQRAFGENKVQDLKEKATQLEELPLEWHFVGNLQKNKINNLIDLNPVLMHSLDSLELAQELDKKYVLQTYARQDVEFISGDNSTLTDSKGKRYIDFTSGIGVTSVGHANARLSSAISEQLLKITHISNLYHIAPQAKAAEMLVKSSGYDMQCFFGNSGAEANEGAIKIARKYGELNGEIKKYKIITLNHSFHGRTITTVKATGQESMHNYFGPFPDGFVYADSINDIKNLIDDHTCAVMIELVQGEGGVEPLDKAKIKKLR